MKIGKIKSYQTFTPNPDGQGRVFNGLEVTAEFLNPNGYVDVLSFKYDYLSHNLQGLVEKVLHTVQKNVEPPKNVREIKVLPLV